MPHVPTAPTEEIGVLTFDEARKPTFREDFDRERWIYIPDFYTEYRYLLGTVGKNPLIAVGVNPSTAMPGKLDNTLKSVERIALGNGYDSFLMFNVYAQRATDPDSMEERCNPLLRRENLRAFEFALSAAAEEGRAPSIWAAWGTVIRKRPYLAACAAELAEAGERFGARWFTCGPRSKVGGHPHHPLYLPKNAPLEPFDVRTYFAGPEG